MSVLKKSPLCIASACLCGIACRYDGRAVSVSFEMEAAPELSSPGNGELPDLVNLPVGLEHSEQSHLPDLATLAASGLVLPFCPEVDGGLPVPREPVELREGRAITRTGGDVTAQFMAGAHKALEAVKQTAWPDGTLLAILKDKSPSCGSTCIYDGSFSGSLLAGRGLTAELLANNGVTVLDERSGLARLAGLSPHFLMPGSACI